MATNTTLQNLSFNLVVNGENFHLNFPSLNKLEVKRSRDSWNGEGKLIPS
jgi:hypothetical protein